MNDTPGNKGRLLKSNDNVRNHSDLNDVVVFHDHLLILNEFTWFLLDLNLSFKFKEDP